ncbi:hypothetical protein [Dyella sp.]|uniref:hypothetical protein n=1 Tax=Dyella sp. TaxID=1869338 RepID=UPI002ED23806
MTLEIRQMVIKSNIDKAADKKKSAADAKAGDCSCDDGDCGGKQPSGDEGLRLRSALLAELERLRER